MFEFAIAKKYHVAVEISRDYLKIAQAEISNKGILISKLITEPIAGLSDEDLAKALNNIISTHNIRVDRIIGILSKEKAMLRYIRLPSVAPDEIENMISFEISKQIPYAREEIISDHRLMHTDEEGYSDIMLAVVHKDEIARIDKILRAGRRLHQVRLSSEAIMSWLKLAAERELTGMTVCLLDIDTDRTEIVIISKDRLELSRVVSVGAAGLSSKHKSLSSKKRLADEIGRSIKMYIKEKQKEKDASVISRCFVTGAHLVIEDFNSFLQEEIDIECSPLNTLSRLPLSDVALTEKGVAQDASVCAVCGSLFVSEGINLAPEELKKKEKAQAKTKGLLHILLFVSAGLVLISSIVLLNLYQKQQVLARVRAMLEQVEPVARETEEKLKRLTVIRQQFAEGATSLDAIYHLYRLMPGNISLLDFNFQDRNRIVRFRGTSTKMSDVFRLATILEDSDVFSNVQTRSVTKRRTKGAEVVDFQIRCNFIAQGEVKE